MFDIMLDRQAVEETEAWQISISATDWEDLLVRWLEELLYLYEVDGVVPHRFLIGQIQQDRLTAEAFGERLQLEKHLPRIQIKAVTYHQLSAKATPEGFEILVIFDI